MEERKDDATQGEPEEATAEPGNEGAVAWLKKRWLLVAVGVLALLTVFIVGAVAIRASKAHKKDVEAQEEKRVVSGAVKDAEAIVVKKETLKAHRAIMEESPAAEPGAAKESKSDSEESKPAPEVGAVPPAAKEEAVAPAPSPAPAAVAQVAGEPPNREAKHVTPPARSPGRAESKAAKLPATAGNCVLTGQAKEDYSQALSRCLEDFNRLDGRGR